MLRSVAQTKGWSRDIHFPAGRRHIDLHSRRRQARYKCRDRSTCGAGAVAKCSSPLPAARQPPVCEHASGYAELPTCEIRAAPFCQVTTESLPHKGSHCNFNRCHGSVSEASENRRSFTALHDGRTVSSLGNRRSATRVVARRWLVLVAGVLLWDIELFAGSIRGFFAIRFNLLLPHFLILLFGHSDSLRRSQVIRSGC